MTIGRVVLLAMCLAPLAACAGRTQVVVRVDADRAVLEDPRYDHLQIEVRALSDPPGGRPRLDEPVYVFPEPAPTPLPFDTVLTPQGDDVSRRYEVVVSAEDAGGSAYVSIAAISGYVPNETRVLHLRLTGDCRDVFCGDGLTCRRSVCESAQIAPLALPALGQPAPDVTAWDGGIADDAGASELDAFDLPGIDADLDATSGDASGDAGPSSLRFTTVSRTSVGSSSAVQHGAAICCSADGAFYATTERLGTHIILYPSVGGMLELRNVAALACQPDGLAVVAGAYDDTRRLSIFTSPSRFPPWMDDQFVDAEATVMDQLGGSVALSSTWLVAGAPARGTAGAAVVFDVTSHSVVSTLASPDTSPEEDRFGAAVASSGDGRTVAVGAPAEDGAPGGVGGAEDEGREDAGVVFVFTSSTWTAGSITAVRIKAPTTSLGAFFGISVALDGSGDWLAVGAPGENAGAGVVYVYHRAGGTWSHVHTLEASNPGAGDRFGDAIAWSSDGTTLVVGAPLEDSTPDGVTTASNEGATDTGALYVFLRTDWSESFLKGYGETSSESHLGASVAASADGRTVYGGAPGYNAGTAPLGAVYQFR